MLVVLCKQKTAYEMRISDWSSDVCSSDLPAVGERPGRDRQRMFDRVEHRPTARVDREQRRRPGIAEQFALHVRTPERLAQSPRHLARQRHLETPVADVPPNQLFAIVQRKPAAFAEFEPARRRRRSEK